MILSKGIGNAMQNPFVKDGKILLGKKISSGDPREDIEKAVDLIGGFSNVISRGDRVLLKPNYNSADPPPASSETGFLRSAVDLLFQYGAKEVIVGESSMEGTSTRRIMGKAGALAKLERSGAELAFFDEGTWIRVNVGGEYLKGVSLAEKAFQADKIIYCCCMKTHFRADFSLSLKLAFGFTKGSERIGFHMLHLKEKLVDLNLVVHPNLVLMDGRKCFITGGPFSGEVREPGMILASGDRVAMDVEALKTIKSYEGSKIKNDPWDYPQVRRAVNLGLGVKNEHEYEVIED